jgi:2'-5' RNA ligase
VEPGKIITDLAAEIDQVLTPLGFERDRQNFIPHLSIGRIRKLRNKEFFHRVIESADQNLIQTERIEKIIFYESILKNSGAEYAVLKEFSLLD